jgi:hypothetical protein
VLPFEGSVAGSARWHRALVHAGEHEPLGPLFAAQLLHALTFAALHLGALGFIARNLPEERAARTTGLYSAASSVALRVGLLASGWLYAAWHGDDTW